MIPAGVVGSLESVSNTQRNRFSLLRTIPASFGKVPRTCSLIPAEPCCGKSAWLCQATGLGQLDAALSVRGLLTPGAPYESTFEWVSQ